MLNTLYLPMLSLALGTIQHDPFAYLYLKIQAVELYSARYNTVQHKLGKACCTYVEIFSTELDG
jgi:hypothetical protein